MLKRLVTMTTLPLFAMAAAAGLSGCQGHRGCGGPECVETQASPQVACNCGTPAYSPAHSAPGHTPDGWMRLEPQPAPAAAPMPMAPMHHYPPAPSVPKNLGPSPMPPQEAQPSEDGPAEAETARIRTRQPSSVAVQSISRSRMLPAAPPMSRQNPIPTRMAPAPRPTAVALQMPEIPSERPKYADPFDDPFFGGGHSVPGIADSGSEPAANAPGNVASPPLQRAPLEDAAPLAPIPEDIDGPALLVP